jgi:hypothetical protein
MKGIDLSPDFTNKQLVALRRLTDRLDDVCQQLFLMSESKRQTKEVKKCLEIVAIIEARNIRTELYLIKSMVEGAGKVGADYEALVSAYQCLDEVVENGRGCSEIEQAVEYLHSIQALGANVRKYLNLLKFEQGIMD